MKTFLAPWMPRPFQGNDYLRLVVVAGLVALVSLLHFLTPVEFRYLHEIYQRLYYLPIVLAAFWWGPVVGVGTAAVSSGAYVLHIRWHWHHVPVYAFNQYAEIFL